MTPRIWAVGSLVCAAAATMLFLAAPVYEGACLGVAEYGPGATRCPNGISHATLVEQNGPRVLWILAVPLALATLGVLLRARRARAAVAVMLGAFALLTGFSIGGAYLPSTLAMALAAWRTPRRPRVRAHRDVETGARRGPG